MKLKDYIKSLDQPKASRGNPLDSYAARAGTTVGYLRVHVASARKPASLRYMRALAKASEGNVSLLEILEHYGVPPEELGKEQAA